jgi:hypothetical protein
MQSETLAQEFARLVKEYHEANDHTKPEAWNLLADFAVDNADAISAALSEKQAVEDSEWHRSNGSMGDVLLYTLREDGWRRGKPMMVNDVMVRIERANGSKTDIEPIVQRIRSALVDVPAEPVCTVALIGAAGSRWLAPHPIDALDHLPVGTPLFVSPPLSREGEDTAEVLRSALQRICELTPARANAKDARDLYHTVKAIADAALAATRSGSASTSKGAPAGRAALEERE